MLKGYAPYHLLYFYSVITCPSLGAITDGQVIYSPDTTSPHDFGTVATFICNTGCSLSGDSARTCGGDGSSQSGVWSGSSPVCLCELLSFQYVQVLQTLSSSCVSAYLVVFTQVFFCVCVSLSVCLQ